MSGVVDLVDDVAGIGQMIDGARSQVAASDEILTIGLITSRRSSRSDAAPTKTESGPALGKT